MTSGLHSHPEVPDGITPREQSPGPPAASLAPVPAWAPLAALVSAFFAAVVAAAVITLGIEAGGGNASADAPALLIPATLIQDAALVAAAVGFAGIWARGLTPASFGLRPTKLRPAVGWTLLAWGAFLLLTAIYVSLVGQPEDQELTRDLADEDSVGALIGWAVLLAFAAPLAEEFFFRGFMFGVLREKLGVAGGALVTSVVFGLVHATGSPIKTLGVLVILGLLLCWLYVRTGSLLPCIALHALNNSLSYAVTRDLSIPGAMAMMLGCTAAAVGVAVAVTRRSPALPGTARTP